MSSDDLASLRGKADRLSAQLPLADSRDEALKLAIDGAESCMRAMKLTQDAADKAQWNTRIKQSLEQAECIKLSDDWQAALRQHNGTRCTSVKTETAPENSGKTVTVKKAKALKEPRSTRQPSKAEQILVLKASQVNGFKFPPWKDAPSPEDFELGPDATPFVDIAELRLSEFQQDVLAGWKRPSEAIPPPSWFPSDRSDFSPTMTFRHDIDLVQDAATDCSVVASLCAGVARGVRGHPKLLGDRLFPYDQAKDSPHMSKNGKYIMKLNFNGCYRRVVIDDKLPVSKTSRVIHVVDRHNPGLLWPALLEKAYLKVRGGYDFPGSNSGTDLWLITGWIPEQVFLRSDELEPDRLWRRAYNAFAYGDVLVTMGTGKMSDTAERDLGLAGEHDYAILDMREVDGQKLLLIKNPWCEGGSWKGSLSVKSSENGDSFQARNNFNDDPEPVQCSRDLLNSDSQLSPGTFWMDLDNVVQHFDSIYLNWNPGLFAHRQDIHFAWDLSGCAGKPRGRFASLSTHPQFTVVTERGGTVWVLLCKHFKNGSSSERETADACYDSDSMGYISLYAFTSNGKRAMLAEKSLHKGPFVDSPQTLMKLEDCRPGVPYTIAPAEQDLPSAEHTFTISVFANSPISLGEAQTKHPYAYALNAAWAKDTAGGNAHSPAYSTNPQFAIAVTQRTSISLLLEALDDNLNVHVKLLHEKGQRIYTVRSRDIVFDSKDYRRGCCIAEHSELEPGQYTIICSTFEPQQLGPFTLRIESSQPARIQQLPKEGAGRIRIELDVAAFREGFSKIACPITATRLVRLYVIARPANHPSARSNSSNRSPMRASIEVGSGSTRRILMISGAGEYLDSSAGIRTQDIDVSPEMRKFGNLWLVLDRMYTSANAEEEAYSIEVYTDQIAALQFGPWTDWSE